LLRHKKKSYINQKILVRRKTGKTEYVVIADIISKKGLSDTLKNLGKILPLKKN